MEFIIKIVTDIGQKCRGGIAIIKDIETHLTIYQLEGIIKTVPWCTTLL